MGVISLTGADLVAALVVGGFRVSRRERGLALLVRGCDAVVVCERSIFEGERIHALLGRAGVEERELLSWMSAAQRTASAGPIQSGFHRRIRTLEDVVQAAKDARVRTDAIDVDARTALAASQQLLEHLPSPPDEARLRATQEALARWQDALQQVEDEERRDRQKRQR